MTKSHNIVQMTILGANKNKTSKLQNLRRFKVPDGLQQILLRLAFLLLNLNKNGHIYPSLPLEIRPPEGERDFA